MKSIFRIFMLAAAHVFPAIALRADPAVIRDWKSVTVGSETRHYVLLRPAQLRPGGGYPLIVGFTAIAGT